MRPSDGQRGSDDGFTLVELLIVTILLALVITVIVAAFATILRATPSTQFRIDDARSTRGLQTYLARDIASAPNGSIDVSNVPGPCGGAAGNNVISLAWTDGSQSFEADYRLIDGEVIRSFCDGATTTTTQITGSVSSATCSGWTEYAQLKNALVPSPLNSLIPPPPTTVPDVQIAYVELCLVSIEEDSGLNRGGGDSQEITMRVTSRHPAP